MRWLSTRQPIIRFHDIGCYAALVNGEVLGEVSSPSTGKHHEWDRSGELPSSPSSLITHRSINRYEALIRPIPACGTLLNESSRLACLATLFDPDAGVVHRVMLCASSALICLAVGVTDVATRRLVSTFESNDAVERLEARFCQQNANRAVDVSGQLQAYGFRTWEVE